MKKYLLGIAGSLACAAFIVTNVSAHSVIIVTPTNTQGFSTADTRPGGSVDYVPDATSVFPPYALQLTTDATTTAKAQYLHDANVPIAQLNTLEYWTKQVSGPSFADPSYQLLVDLNGAADGGFTTFVYEPYQNGTVTPATWQQWDVDAGQLWSSKSFSDGVNCEITAGAGGAPFYTIPDLKLNCPDAVVVGFGVNIGSNNPSYVVETDALNFNGTTYDFEADKTPSPSPTIAPTATPIVTPSATPSTTPSATPVVGDKDACKKDGWKNFTNPTFKNQGQCVSYFNHI